MVFEKNQGQADPAVKFLARGPGYQIFLAEREMALRFFGNAAPATQDSAHPAKLKDAVLRVRFMGSQHNPLIRPQEPLEFKSNYFTTDAAVTDIKNYARVLVQSLYRGIDVVYYGNPSRLEWDFIVHPGARPEQIQLRLAGAKHMTVSRHGDLLISTAAGEVKWHKPLAYQETGARREPVEVRYVLANSTVTLALGSYDSKRPLIIDPIVSYSTFTWGAAADVATDAAGNSYLVGWTQSKDLPTVSGYQIAQMGTSDAYVIKLDPSATKAVYATYLGVRRSDTSGQHIAVDSAGQAYIAGTTTSSSFPVTAGAYQTTTGTALSYFAAKLNADGNALVYSTYYPAYAITGIALDSIGNLYLTGSGQVTQSGQVFISKLNPSGTALAYAAVLGYNGDMQTNGIAVDASGSAYVTGKTTSTFFPTVGAYQTQLRGASDAFVAKLKADGSALQYSTYLGGSDKDQGNAIAVNASGEVYVAGQTYSSDFPVSATAFQRTKGYNSDPVSNGFIAKLSASGTALQYASYLGGSWCAGCWSADYDNDAALSLAVDAAGYAYVGGRARSPAFPVVESIQRTVARYDGTGAWPFLAKVNPAGDELIYSILLGENGVYDKSIISLALDAAGNLHAVGDMDVNYSLTHPLTSQAWFSSSAAAYYKRFFLKLGTPLYPTLVKYLAPTMAGTPLLLQAVVQNPMPGGTVTFRDGTAVLGTVAATNGGATLNVSLSAGVHNITASYSLDGIVSPPVFPVVNVR